MNESQNKGSEEMKTKPKDAKIRNVIVKHRYFLYLDENRYLSEKTIYKHEASVRIFEEHIGYRDFGVFNKKIAREFKASMQKRVNKKGNTISGKTILFHLKSVQQFLIWLNGQPGYKRKYTQYDVGVLNLKLNKVREIMSAKKIIDLPTVADTIQIIKSIKSENPVDYRDQAVYAVLLCAGVRSDTLISLPISSLNIENMTLDLNPAMGVRTKFGEHTFTKVFNHDKKLIQIILDWRSYLVNQLGFKPMDPLFPKTDQTPDKDCIIYTNKNLTHDFWKNESSLTNMMRKRASAAGLTYFHPHLYRHSAILISTRKTKTPEEFKALSQNYSHKSILDTLLSYAPVSIEEQLEILKKLDDRKTDNNDENDKTHDKKEIKDLIKSHLKDLFSEEGIFDLLKELLSKELREK